MYLREMYFIRGAVLALGTALILTSCGGSGGKQGAVSTGVVTVIGTSDQGAQAAATSVASAKAAATLGIKLSDMTATAAATVASLPGVYIPVTFDCSSRLPVSGGSTNSITVVQDYFSGLVTATMNACASGETAVTGTMTVDASGSPLVFTLGSGATPLVVTGFAAAGSAAVTSRTDVLATVTSSSAGATNTLVVTGWVENRDYVRQSHDRYDLNGVSFAVTKSSEIIGLDPYDAATVTTNGVLTRTAYLQDAAATIDFSETDGFTNFVTVMKTPAAGSAAQYEYLTITGELSVAATPPNACIDGAFMIATNADLRLDSTTGAPVAGQLTINNAVAGYNADSSLTVAVNGGAAVTYPAETLGSLCPI